MMKIQKHFQNLFQNKMHKKHFLLLVEWRLIALAAAVFLFLVFLITTMVLQQKYERLQQELSLIIPPTLAEQSDAYFKDSNVKAESFMVYDFLYEDLIAEKNSSEVYGLASLTKIMTALIALDYQNSKGVSLDVTLTPESIVQPGDNNLYAYETWELDDLVEYMLVTSSNDAAHAIAETLITGDRDGEDKEIPPYEAFLSRMDNQIVVGGLETLSFKNTSGLDLVKEEGGEKILSAQGSAEDVMYLMKYVWDHYPEIMEASSVNGFVYTANSDRSLIAENTNIVLNQLPPIRFSKTGYTDLAGGTLAFIFEVGPGHEVGVVLLGSTFQGRFNDARVLADRAIQALYHFENE